MPARGRRDAGDRESSGEHRRSSQSTPSQNSPSAVVEPRRRTSRNRLEAADSSTSTALELNKRPVIRNPREFQQRLHKRLQDVEIRHLEEMLARKRKEKKEAEEQMERQNDVDAVDEVASKEEEVEEEEEVDVVN